MRIYAQCLEFVKVGSAREFKTRGLELRLDGASCFGHTQITQHFRSLPQGKQKAVELKGKLIDGNATNEYLEANPFCHRILLLKTLSVCRFFLVFLFLTRAARLSKKNAALKHNIRAEVLTNTIFWGLPDNSSMIYPKPCSKY